MAKTALITGGTGGLGSAVTARLLAGGWRVVVPWVHEHELERVTAHNDLTLIRADLTDPGAVAELVSRAAADPESPLGAVVNLVGGFDAPGRVHEVSLERFEEQFRLNLRPTYLVTQAALGPMTAGDGGAIVCVGTRAALEPFSGAAGYIASKAAVLAFVRAVALEYRDEGVRVNAILPSVIDTPANRKAMPNADHGKWVTPEAIAGVIAHLVSEDSSPTSGALIPVYGRA